MNVVWGLGSMRLHVENWAKVLDWTPMVGVPLGDNVDQAIIMGMYDIPTYAQTLKQTSKAKERHIHWCGSDVIYLNNPELLPANVTYSCGSEALKKELYDKGVDAITIPDPTKYKFEKPLPFPKEPGVSIYIGYNPQQYGLRFAEVASEIFPSVHFMYYGQGTKESDLEQIFRDTTVHMRITDHDGSAITAREFLEAGRYLVSTLDLPGTYRVRPVFTEIANALEQALVDSESGPRGDVAKYYREYNSISRLKESLREVGLWGI